VVYSCLTAVALVLLHYHRSVNPLLSIGFVVLCMLLMLADLRFFEWQKRKLTVERGPHRDEDRE